MAPIKGLISSQELEILSAKAISAKEAAYCIHLFSWPPLPILT